MTSQPLPISTTETTAASSATTTTLTSLRTFLTRLFSSLRTTLSHRRPWLELVDRTAFSRPLSLSDATTRVRKNFSYFKVNYLTILAIVLAFSLLSHPFSLLTLLSLVAAWLGLYAFRPSDQPLVVLGRTMSNREVLGILVLVTVIVVFLTSVGSLIITAVLVGVGIVCVHGAFRDPEDLFMDDQDIAGSTGLFSFIGGPSAGSNVIPLV
ncbi:PREDICTED: PRA1 family protein B3-like [Populus euphratica]|uniref:PRA1 family protein n=1 Tax=Populus euphratica TaxID=75702 RepID=A0AAJ6XD64_POPEU|nr:PREDICTED: PRA1 family protein B3-like [Populus euphratica]XP_011041834.1 PREDICTED: PRA1 family protein B3-like [Populus euphratica]